MMMMINPIVMMVVIMIMMNEWMKVIMKMKMI